jgi:hypothetical protein
VARHGLVWYEIDINWYGITALRMLGLAWDIKMPKQLPGKEFAENPPSMVDASVPAVEVLAAAAAGD